MSPTLRTRRRSAHGATASVVIRTSFFAHFARADRIKSASRRYFAARRFLAAPVIRAPQAVYIVGNFAK
ncbi:MAG: hypothetical protein DBX39_04760 [Bacillota bacterium]|nr:MAG: hypothetical protein DBX39_04760 [Bacillota bacterium]